MFVHYIKAVYVYTYICAYILLLLIYGVELYINNGSSQVVLLPRPFEIVADDIIGPIAYLIEKEIFKCSFNQVCLSSPDFHNSLQLLQTFMYTYMASGEGD